MIAMEELLVTLEEGDDDLLWWLTVEGVMLTQQFWMTTEGKVSADRICINT